MDNTTWIKPGASVVTYTQPHGSTRWISRHVKVQKILRVNQQSFTTEDGERFRLSDQSSTGGTAWSEKSRCVSYGSAEARRVLAEVKRRAAENRADAAIVAWQRKRSEENLLTLITTLQEVPRDTVEKAQ